MGVSITEGSWLRSVFGRSLLVGAALGTISLTGSTLVLAQTGAGTANVVVLVGSAALAVAIGLWAGAPAASNAGPPLRERWLSAAAVTATAGAFASVSAVYQQMLPGPWWAVGGLLVTVAAPCYALGLLIPSLFGWAERWLDAADEEAGGWRALGPIAIGIPIGCAAGVLLVGLLALSVWPPGSVLMAAAMFLLLPLIAADPAEVPAREVVVFRTTSSIAALTVTEVRFPGERQPERRLYLNDEEESGQLVRSGAPTLAYIAAAEHWLSEITPPGARYLFLGGGAYTLPRRLVERDPSARAVVVELDPEVTRIAYRYFGLQRQHPIEVVHGDARAYLEHDDGRRFDRIYLDVYGGREALPHSLITQEAAQALYRRLEEKGVAGVNLIGTTVGEENRRLWSIIRTYEKVFPRIAVYMHLGRDFPDRQNLLVALARDSEREFPRTAGYFEEWPASEWPEVTGVTTFRDLHLGAKPTSQQGRDEAISSEPK